MIIKLHGNSGSGKTTIARELMDRADALMRCPDFSGKIEANECRMASLLDPLFILGSYQAVCGGMDSISDFTRHPVLIDKYDQEGHVLYEGLLASEFYGKLGDASVKHGDNYIFAFLDTPLELCIERIRQRRAAAGNFKEFNVSNTEARPAKIGRLKQRLIQMGRIVVDIHYEKAADELLELYRKSE